MTAQFYSVIQIYYNITAIMKRYTVVEIIVTDNFQSCHCKAFLFNLEMIKNT